MNTDIDSLGADMVLLNTYYNVALAMQYFTLSCLRVAASLAIVNNAISSLLAAHASLLPDHIANCEEF